MKNILKFIDTWGIRIVFFLVLIIFLKTCTTNTKVERLEKTLSIKIQKIDSIVTKINSTHILTEDELVGIIKETPAWKSLELEELSDKNRIPINKLKNEHEGN